MNFLFCLSLQALRTIRRINIDSLRVKLTLVTSDSLKDILDQVEDGEAHVAAAGLTVTDERKQKVLFAPAYQSITQQLIDNRKTKNKPKKLADLKNGKLEVIANSSHV